MSALVWPRLAPGLIGTAEQPGSRTDVDAERDTMGRMLVDHRNRNQKVRQQERGHTSVFHFHEFAPRVSVEVVIAGLVKSKAIRTYRSIRIDRVSGGAFYGLAVSHICEWVGDAVEDADVDIVLATEIVTAPNGDRYALLSNMKLRR